MHPGGIYTEGIQRMCEKDEKVSWTWDDGACNSIRTMMGGSIPAQSYRDLATNTPVTLLVGWYFRDVLITTEIYYLVVEMRLGEYR